MDGSDYEARKRDRGEAKEKREEGRDEIERSTAAKSWRVIVWSSCAQGGAVSSLMEKE